MSVMMDHSVQAFFNAHREEFEKALFLAEVSEPQAFNNRMYRMLKPKFFNFIVNKYFGDSITFVDDLSYDWLIKGKRIAVRSLHDQASKVFPRMKKDRQIRGAPIIVKNILSNRRLDNEFDYMLLRLSNSESTGMYLVSYSKIVNLIDIGRGGYNGNGQIEFNLSSREDCENIIELPDARWFELCGQYNVSVDDDYRNEMFASMMLKAFEQQIGLTRKKVE